MTVLAMVTLPTFINSVLMQPGEVVEVDLEALGVESLGAETPGLVPHDGPLPDAAPLSEVPSSEGKAEPAKPEKPAKA